MKRLQKDQEQGIHVDDLANSFAQSKLLPHRSLGDEFEIEEIKNRLETELLEQGVLKDSNNNSLAGLGSKLFKNFNESNVFEPSPINPLKKSVFFQPANLDE